MNGRGRRKEDKENKDETRTGTGWDSGGTGASFQTFFLTPMPAALHKHHASSHTFFCPSYCPSPFSFHLSFSAIPSADFILPYFSSPVFYTIPFLYTWHTLYTVVAFLFSVLFSPFLLPACASMATSSLTSLRCSFLCSLPPVLPSCAFPPFTSCPISTLLL